MAKKQVHKLIGLLDILSREDQKRVRDRCNELLGGSHTIADSVSGSENDWLLDGIRHELGTRGLPFALSYQRLAEMPEYRGTEKRAGFLEAAKTVGPWLRGLLPGASRARLVALSCTAAGALASYLSAFSDVGLRQMLWNYNYVPDAFEREFPGYAANKWVAALVASRCHEPSAEQCGICGLGCEVGTES